MLITAILIGVGVAVGVLIVLRLSLFPKRVSMRNVLNKRPEVLGRSSARSSGSYEATRHSRTKPNYGDTALRLIGKLNISSAGATQRLKDLSLLNKDPGLHTKHKVLAGVFGVLIGVAIGIGIMQIDIDLSVPSVVITILLGILFGLGGFIMPDLQIKGEATKARKEFEILTVAWLELVTPLIAAGRDVTTAFLEATSLGLAWPFQLLGQYMNEARRLGRPIWVGLRNLIHDKGLKNLEQLASSMELSQRSGAEIRHTVVSQVQAYRERAHQEAVVKSEFSGERFGAPLALTLAAFMVLIGFPAVATLTSFSDLFDLPSPTTPGTGLILPFWFW